MNCFFLLKNLVFIENYCLFRQMIDFSFFYFIIIIIFLRFIYDWLFELVSIFFYFISIKLLILLSIRIIITFSAFSKNLFFKVVFCSSLFIFILIIFIFAFIFFLSFAFVGFIILTFIFEYVFQVNIERFFIFPFSIIIVFTWFNFAFFRIII